MINYATMMDLMIGEPMPKLDKAFVVGTGRVGNQMAVYVSNDYDQRFHKYVSLRWHWWQRNSPAERIRRTIDKAQGIADRLNHEELYLAHEAGLVDRE